MKLTTELFGEIEINDEEVIDFDEGIPGFQDDKKFVLLYENDDRSNIFCWLHSVSKPNLAFALLDVLAIKEDYKPELPRDSVLAMGSENDEYRLYNIVVIPENIEEMTVNLAAPIVINVTSKKGKQVIIQDDKYGIRHKVFGEIIEAKSKEEGK